MPAAVMTASRLLRTLARAARDAEVRKTLELALRRREMSAQTLAASSIGPGTYFTGGARVVGHEQAPNPEFTVGAYCSIADGVDFVLAGNHSVSHVSTFPFWPSPAAFEAEFSNTRGPIVVGNDVWIGKAAMILSGVTIGDGAVVAARAVVTSDVEPYAIVGGVPAKPIGSKRFSDEQIERLLEIRWWNWPEAELRSIWRKLNGGTVEELLEYASQRRSDLQIGTTSAPAPL